MNAVMDFPPLPVIDEPPEIVDEVVDAAPAALVTLREHTMQPLSVVEKGIADLRAEHGSTAYDIKTPAGYRLATLRRAAVRAVRYAVPKIVKAKKAELAGLREQVEEEGERIVGLLRAIEDPHDALIAAEDTRKEAIKAAAVKAEAERVENHQTNIDLIRSWLPRCQEPGMTAARIALGIDTLAQRTFPKETWEEFDVVAANAQCETLEAMRKVYDQAVEREAKEEADRIEAARVEAQRVENEKAAAELAALKKKIDDDNAALAERTAQFEADQAAARAAAQKVEDDRIAAMNAEESQLQAIERETSASRTYLRADEPLSDQPAGLVLNLTRPGPALIPVDANGFVTNDGLAALRAESTPAVDAEVASMLDAMPGEILGATTEPAEIEAGLSEDPPALVEVDMVPLVPIEAVNDWLAGPRVSIDFLYFLGIHPTLVSRYAAAQFPAIKAALIAHLQGLK